MKGVFLWVDSKLEVYQKFVNKEVLAQFIYKPT